jgi:hypothetical protein
MSGTPNKQTAKIGEGRSGPGRPKGSVNKTTAAIKDMVTAALDKAGGADYLYTQALENPNAFLTLVGKVLPLQVTGPGDNGEFTVRTITRNVIDHASEG